MSKSNWGSDISGFWRAGGGIRVAFLAYAVFTFGLLLSVGILGIGFATQGTQPTSSMQRFAASVIPPFFLDMMSLEVPHLSQEREGDPSTFAGKRVLGYLTASWLQVNPAEPRSLLAGELRGLTPDPAASPGQGTQRTGGGVTASKPTPSGTARPSATPAPAGTGTGGPSPSPTLNPSPSPVETKPVSGTGGLTTQGKKAVLVYHSHPRESWVPELNAKTVGEAESADDNITLVGKRLADQLELAGIGAIHSATDYKTTVPQYNWNFSYKYSLQTVQEAFAVNDKLTFLFDIHRDSATRDITTASINGKDYAKVYFIVGKKNEKWEQNEAFAQKIHDRLQAEYPGISRGIWDKGTGGHGEYNQSLSPNSMLMEVGGAYNTLEESYRTADVLAKIIADLYWDAEKVGGQASAAVKKAPGGSG